MYSFKLSLGYHITHAPKAVVGISGTSDIPCMYKTKYVHTVLWILKNFEVKKKKKGGRGAWGGGEHINPKITSRPMSIHLQYNISNL